MDKLSRYREIIRAALLPYANLRFADPGIVNKMVVDKDQAHYLVVTTGWEGKSKRVYFNLVHLDIINGKVWIQYDGTEDGVGYDLEAAGIPKEDIVPAFHPEDVRIHTGYGVW